MHLLLSVNFPRYISSSLDDSVVTPQFRLIIYIIASSYEQALCHSPQCRLLLLQKTQKKSKRHKNKAIPAETEQATAWALKTWQAWAIQCLPSDDSNKGPEMQHLYNK